MKRNNIMRLFDLNEKRGKHYQNHAIQLIRWLWMLPVQIVSGTTPESLIHANRDCTKAAEVLKSWK